MRVAILAAAIVPDDIFDPFKEVKEAPDPLKPVAVSNPEDELNVRLDPLLGPRLLPVAAVVNIGKHVVSDDSSATVILDADAPWTAPNESTPAPSVIRACPLLP